MLAGEIDLYGVALNAGVIARHWLDRRKAEHRARGNVECSAVPWTSDHGAVQVTFSKRAVVMSTQVLDRVITVINVKNRDVVTFDLDDDPLTVG